MGGRGALGAEFERRRRENRCAEGVGCVEGYSPPHWGGLGLEWTNIFVFGSQIGELILVQTVCFLYSSPKAVPTSFKITLGTPFPGVPLPLEMIPARKTFVSVDVAICRNLSS